MNRTVDYSALIRPVSPSEVAAFRARARSASNNGVAAMAQLIFIAIMLSAIGIVLVILAAASIASAISAIAEPGANPVNAFVALLPLLLIAGLVAVGIFVARRLWAQKWEAHFRLSAFAADNGMIYSPNDYNPNYPGQIFTIGDTRRVTDHLRSSSGRFLDIGNYQYSTGSGKSRSTHTWGFMALHLDRRLPNMVLDSTANNHFFGVSNLPATLSRNQVLSLEGDFNTYFTLYCPREYERDALYVFTPDLMALLIDEASPFDVEIVDDWMFIYSSTPFNPVSPALYQRLFRIVDTVGAKTLSQTDRYVDERVGQFAPNVVAPQGRRLSRGVSTVAVAFVVVFAAIWFSPWLFGLFGLFGF